MPEVKRNLYKDPEDDLAAGWIMRMAMGESDALSALYRLYHRPLLSIFLGILRNREAAEETLQDTFIKAFHKARIFNPSRGTAFAWLVTIGRRLAIDRLRRDRARQHNELPEQSDFTGVNTGETGEEMKQRLEYDWLAESMQSLTNHQQEIIDMAFYQGYTHIEIAEKLDMPIGTVKSHLYRGLDALRKHYLGNNNGH